MKKLISLVIRFIPRPILQRFSGFGLTVLGIFYSGNAVQCPVCSRSYRQFLPYGRISTRPNALCPGCQSLERHRLIWLYLERETNFFQQPQDVLHIAPEACFMKPFEKVHGKRYITADLESPLAAVKMDIHKMPFNDQSFDMVLCNHVLEHVDNDIQALREIRRVLRPGGKAILQVPFFSPVPPTTDEDIRITDPRERERRFGQDDHVRKYGLDYPQRITQSGLRVDINELAARLSAEEVFHSGISGGEKLYIGIRD